MSGGGSSTAAGVAQGGDELAVRDVALDYVESWYAADATRMERAVHPELAKRFYRDLGPATRFLEEIGASKFLHWTASGGGRSIPVEHQHRDVAVLDVFFRAAMAKVTAASGVEYLQLGKFDADWRIINILGAPRTGGPLASPLFSASRPTAPPDTVESDLRVKEAGRSYAEGWYTADSSRVGTVIHPQWSKKGVRLTRAGGFFLESWGAEKMSQWTASLEHQADRQDLGLEKSRISVLDQDRDIAAVKVDWDFDARGRVGSVDYLSLAKADDTWRAVNILWQDARRDGDDLLGEAETAGWIL